MGWALVLRCQGADRSAQRWELRGCVCLVQRHVEVDSQRVVDQLVHHEGGFGADGQIVFELEDKQHEQQDGARRRDDDARSRGDHEVIGHMLEVVEEELLLGHRTSRRVAASVDATPRAAQDTHAQVPFFLKTKKAASTPMTVVPRRLPTRPLVAHHTHTSHIAPPGPGRWNTQQTPSPQLRAPSTARSCALH